MATPVPPLSAEMQAAVRDLVEAMAQDITDKAAAQIAAKSVGELDKARFDYAWKWFAYHADQRVKMFNYMLVAVGILANAAVAAVNAGLPFVGIAVCGLAAVLLAIFALLDARNRYLVNMGEDILRDLEKTVIYVANPGFVNAEGNPATYGLLTREKSNDAPLRAKLGKHRIWLPGIACVLVAVFLVAGVYFALDKDAIAARAPSVAKAPAQTLKVQIVP